MSLGDFLKAPVKAAGKGRSNQSQQRSKARVKDFNRDELESAASAMQQSPPGALDSFLGNVGSAFRPAGTFAAAAVDAVGGDGATKGLVSQVRAGSEAYKQSGLSGFLGKVPGIGSALDAAMNAPTGSSSNTMLGQGFAKAKELVTGVKEQDYLTDEFKARVARATEGSGFNDVARSIAENRQGQSQDNLVERTLGKLPAVGAYFDKNQPSVEDRAIEAGATPEQAAFISMLNPLEWVNAESKIDAEAKLAKAGKFRKGLNAVASPIVDPMQAAIDWAMPGKALAPPIVEAKPIADVSPPGSIQEAFANNLGVSVDTLPALDNIAKPIAEVLPADDLAKQVDASPAAIAPQGLADNIVDAVPPAPVADAILDTPAPLAEALPPTENPVFAAARAALKDPSLGDAVDQLDEVAPTWALEIPESKPLTLEEKVNTVAEAAASKVRRGAEPGTSIDLATAPIQKKVADSAKVDVERLHALEQSIETVKNSDLPPVQRKKKLAALQQEATALNRKLESSLGIEVVDDATHRAEVQAFKDAKKASKQGPSYGMPVAGGLPLPTMQQLKAFKGDVDYLVKKFADNTVEMRASLSRWFSSTSLGKVDAKTTSAIRDGAEAADGFSRTLADAYHKVVNGNIAGIIGSQHGGVYNLGQKEKVAIRDFMGGRVANGVKVDEAALQAMGLPQDVIDVSKLVRGMMDQTSDALMAETHNLPLAWFTKLNDEDRAIVAGLAQTASKPKARVAFEKGVDPAKIQFLNDARQKVDDGFAELNAAGHWLDGEDPRDMLLAWAPYLANRGTYQPLLYRLFEHGVLSKGDDAMQLYIQTLKGKGVNVPAEVEAFLYSNWMAGGAKGKGFGNELDRIKKRNPNMPQAIKELLQEIEDPAYSYATGIFQVNRLRHQLGLRRWMAGQDKFVSRAGESAVDFALRNGWKNGEFVELADNVGANTRNFGAMQGRFVHRDFWDLAYQVHALPGTAGGADAFMRFNKEILQRWKFWHTVANPASHIRQGVQNLVSVYLAGGNRAVFNMGAAVKEYKSRGKYFAMAREHGLLGNKSLHDIAEKIDDSAWRHLDFNAAESFIARMGRFGEAIANVSQGFRSGSETKRLSGKWAAAKWQMVDEVARIALLKTYVDKGWDVAKAAEAVKGEVYGGVRRSRFDQTLAGIPPSSTFADLGGDGSLRALGIKALSLASQGVNIPFWGASRFILEQTLRNFAGMKPGTWTPLTDPGRMARTMGLVMAGYGLHKMAQTAEGMEPADEVSQRPDYQRPYLPMHARIPSQWMELIDDKGKVGYFDMSWALPWGNLAAGGFDPKTGKMKWRGGSSELVQVSPLWKPLAEVYFNKDLFRAEIGARPEIYNPLDTSTSKARKSVAHLWRSYLPPWAPNLAGGVVDAMRFDGGADGRVDAKEAFRAFMQGVASDSGHSASKLASGIFNSFDYWWDKAHPDGQERLQVSDYMGREQYLVKAVADALAVKVTSTDLSQIQKRRVSAQTTAIKEMSNYYQQQRSNTTNPATQRRLREEESKYIRQIKAGKPVARWYDEDPEDTVRNVRNFFSDFFSR